MVTRNCFQKSTKQSAVVRNTVPHASNAQFWTLKCGLQESEKLVQVIAQDAYLYPATSLSDFSKRKCGKTEDEQADRAIQTAVPLWTEYTIWSLKKCYCVLRLRNVYYYMPVMHKFHSTYIRKLDGFLDTTTVCALGSPWLKRYSRYSSHKSGDGRGYR